MDSKISLLSSDQSDTKDYGSTIQDTDIDAELAKDRADKGQTSGGFEIAPGQVTVNLDGHYGGFSFRKLWAYTGPGFLMSIAFLDPGNIEADLQGGAVAKYKLLWVLLWTTILGLIMQLLSARLGCVVGMNLADVCRHEYPRAPRLVIWVMMELAIITNDIQEVIGSALAINLLSSNRVPIWAGVLITGADTFTFLFLESYGLRKLEALFGTLITTMAGSFIYMYITVVPDQIEVVKGVFIPWCEDCSKDDVEQIVGLLGAIIQPSNLYLHSALVLSRMIDRTDKKAIKEANFYNAIESAIALFVSLLINLSVMTVFAAAFSDPDHKDASLSNAGTYAGQFVMQGFINIKWAKWKRVLLTRSIAILPTIIVAILATKDLDAMNNWVNVFQSVALPFALLPVLTCTSDERIMGQFKNGTILKGISWSLALLVMVANFYLILIFVGPGEQWYVYALTAILSLIYVAFVTYMAIGPTRTLHLKLFVYRKLHKDVSAVLEEVRRRDDIKYTEFNEDKQPSDEGKVNA